MAYEKIAFRASRAPGAQQVLAELTKAYGNVKVDQADVIVAIGGDGYMLQSLHDILDRHLDLPLYGINQGTVGFLMNVFDDGDLIRKLNEADITTIRPLCMEAKPAHGDIVAALAINEVSLLRSTRQTAKIRVIVDGKVRIGELACDGVLVATPAGSTAYNLSAHGPILPIDSRLLALTPISAFRPRRWRGALLPHRAEVRFEILEQQKRPVNAVADFKEAKNVLWVEVREDRDRSLHVLFDKGHNLDERILIEQFYH